MCLMGDEELGLEKNVCGTVDGIGAAMLEVRSKEVVARIGDI